MLPKPLRDKKVRFFKFWFNHRLQHGLHYQNELYYRVQSVECQKRFQLYRMGQQLAQQGADILITRGAEPQSDQHSLWVSLRSHPRVLAQLHQLALYSLASALAQPPAVVASLALAATSSPYVMADRER